MSPETISIVIVCFIAFVFVEEGVVDVVLDPVRLGELRGAVESFGSPGLAGHEQAHVGVLKSALTALSPSLSAKLICARAEASPESKIPCHKMDH